jgi:Beta-lactamase
MTVARVYFMPVSQSLVTLGIFLCLGKSLLLAQTSQTRTILPAETQHRIEKVESCLTGPVVIKGDLRTCHTLTERMAELHVPGLSIAVVHNGVIDWVQGFGVQQLRGKPVGTDTPFQAGSISKPVAAMAALHLVAGGKLSLDSDVYCAHDMEDSRKPRSAECNSYAAGVTDAHGGLYRPWLSWVCGECSCACPRAGFEWRETGEHGSDPVGKCSRLGLEILGGRLYRDAAGSSRCREGTFPEVAARYSSCSDRDDARHLRATPYRGTSTVGGELLTWTMERWCLAALTRIQRWLPPACGRHRLTWLVT